MSENVLDVESDKAKNCCWGTNSKGDRIENWWEQVASEACDQVEEYHVAKSSAIFYTGTHV